MLQQMCVGGGGGGLRERNKGEINNDVKERERERERERNLEGRDKQAMMALQEMAVLNGLLLLHGVKQFS